MVNNNDPSEERLSHQFGGLNPVINVASINRKEGLFKIDVVN